MYTIYAAEKDNPNLQFITKCKTLLGAKRIYTREHLARQSNCHGKIVNEKTKRETKMPLPFNIRKK